MELWGKRVFVAIITFPTVLDLLTCTYIYYSDEKRGKKNE